MSFYFQKKLPLRGRRNDWPQFSLFWRFWISHSFLLVGSVCYQLLPLLLLCWPVECGSGSATDQGLSLNRCWVLPFVPPGASVQKNIVSQVARIAQPRPSTRHMEQICTHKPASWRRPSPGDPQTCESDNKCLLLNATEISWWFVMQHYYEQNWLT